jgi:Ca2+/Na+ antiporter
VLKSKSKLFLKRFREAWTSCLLFMVQGDLTAITIGHVLTASKTVIIAGLAFVILSFSKILKDDKMTITITIGILTMIADYMIHPTHFGPSLAEAVCTGVGAAVIAYLMIKYVDKKEDK